jgi:hypothetical protein
VEDAGAESFGSQPSQVVEHPGAGVGFQRYSQELGNGLTERFNAHSTSIYTFTEANGLPWDVRRQEHPLLSNKPPQIIIHTNP